MISDEQLDRFRMEGTKICVLRDDNSENNVKGIVVAWDEESVIIRKQNRKVVRLDRQYRYEPL